MNLTQLLRKKMEKETPEAIAKSLEGSLIINRTDVGFKEAKIVEYRTTWDNGYYLLHSNGDRYGLAFFNAFTVKGIEKIRLALNSNLSSKEILDIIEQNRLRDYFHGNTKSYSETKTGDEGVLYMSNLDDMKTVSLANNSARDRKFNTSR